MSVSNYQKEGPCGPSLPWVLERTLSLLISGRDKEHQGGGSEMTSDILLGYLLLGMKPYEWLVKHWFEKIQHV